MKRSKPKPGPNPGFDSWRMPTQEELRSAGIGDESIARKHGKITRIPYSLLLKHKPFEPYTIRDIAHPDTEKRVKRIAQGFQSNAAMPLVVGISDRNGKINVIDGFTRSAVAIPMKVKIKALVIPQRYLATK